MGRASSSKKVARAAKASGRPGTKKSYVWPASIGLVVLLGVGLIAVSAAERDSADAAPIIGDHWHAAYGVYACDGFLPPVTDAKADESGIHSHSDGLIHIHPRSTRYSGEDADLGAFGETTALELEDDSITMPDGQTFRNGDDCGGEAGVVQVKVWSGPSDAEGRLLESDFADFAPQDGDLVTIAFVPEGAEIPQPESAGVRPTDVPTAPGATAPATTAPGASAPATTTDTSTGEDADTTTTSAP